MLSHKTRYVQIALNSTLSDAYTIIRQLPQSERILLEAGTPLIKQFGMDAVSQIYRWASVYKINPAGMPYVVADLKTMDRGQTEVEMARSAGASAAVALGIAPIETLNIFIETCNKLNMDSMIDMMNVDQPVKIVRKLRKPATCVILHRGVDEEVFNKDKPIPFEQINKLKAGSDTLISIAGGDTIREVQRAFFNDANIAVLWKNFYSASGVTSTLVNDFLKVIK